MAGNSGPLKTHRGGGDKEIATCKEKISLAPFRNRYGAHLPVKRSAKAEKNKENPLSPVLQRRMEGGGLGLRTDHKVLISR